MSRRDTYTLGVVGVLGVLAAFWFGVLGPKRADLSELNNQVKTSEGELQVAKQEAQQFAQARLDFPSDYATLARLGKAVPVDPDVPSLIVQLDRAASRANVNFRTLTVEEGDATEATPPAPAPAAPGAATGSTGASGASSGTGTTGAAGSSSTGSTGAPGTPAPADATAAAGLPAGTDLGSAALSMTKFNLTFEGSFFRMAGFIHNIRSLVQRRNRQLYVSGRLVSVDGISFGPGKNGFPQVKATMAVTSYLLPQSQGIFAGATPQGPAGTTAATPSPPSSSGAGAPPAAVVTPR